MIQNVGGKFLNNWLIPCKNGYVLIDTGFPRGYDAFLKRLTEKGIALSDIRYVVITHMHSTRVGFLQKLLLTTEAVPIYNGEDRIRLESGKNNMNTYISRFDLLVANKIASAFVERTQCFPAVFRENFLDASKQPLSEEGIEFLTLSGHSEHDTCILYDGKLFCGDVFSTGFFSSHRAPMWIYNKYKLLDEWREIEKLNVSEVYPATGKPFRGEEIPKAIEYWRARGVFRL